MIVTSFLDGSVQEILVQEGDLCEAGDDLILIECMKTYYEIKAPISGTILKIFALNGEIVTKGAKLLEIEG